EASLDPLVTIGPDGKIIDVNMATEQVTGVGRRQLIGSDFSNYFTEPDRASAGYRQVLAEGHVHDYPLTIRHVSGSTTDVLYNATEYRDEAGDVQGVFAAARDITKRKKAEAALKELNETLELRVADRTAELARSNEDLEQFAYVASHDLQEPLRQVGSFTKLLSERYGAQFDGKAGEWMSYITEGSARMSRLIEDLLAYSRVDRRGRQFAAVDLREALDDALANLRISIGESRAEVVAGPLPTVPGDRTQLTLLLQNLIGNAIKFRREGAAPLIRVEARPDADGWAIAVRDNGIGIAAEHFDRVFLIFQRLHTRQKYPGTGIGLAICRRIVERHGGRIWVESTLGEGSTFCFTLANEGQP
ncbi:MAG: ATP-binding protein, partial [Phycisphaerae bacterium]|nr:ATP-binding protein [Phycisphaerae bacterium]